MPRFRIRIGRASAGTLFVGGAALLAVGVAPGLAQDATPEQAAGRPVVLQTGSCDDPGEVVATLSDLTPFEGETVGQESAVVAESSYTNVPIAPEEIQADDHVVNASASADDDTSVACGEVGGPLSPNGTLIVGLREQNDSGFTGVAYLSPGGDGASTDVSVFIAPNLDGDGTGGRTVEVAPAASPVASADDEAAAQEQEPDETVEVSLVEWSVDLASEPAAGLIAFDARNDGTIRHSLAIEGDGTEGRLPERLQPGESGTLTVELDPGTYTLYCPVGNHRNEGMETEIVVG